MSNWSNQYTKWWIIKTITSLNKNNHKTTITTYWKEYQLLLTIRITTKINTYNNKNNIIYNCYIRFIDYTTCHCSNFNYIERNIIWWMIVIIESLLIVLKEVIVKWGDTIIILTLIILVISNCNKSSHNNNRSGKYKKKKIRERVVMIIMMMISARWLRRMKKRRSYYPNRRIRKTIK